jgi:membrane protein implicated in regulation of membrane protease activity
MEASDWVWVWAGATAVFAVIEMVTPFMFFSISFAVGAGLAAIAAALDASVGLQWGLFVGVTAGALFVLVPIGRRLMRSAGDDSPEGASRWVGRTAIVLQEIPAGSSSTGLVRLERAQWRAETPDGGAIPAGEEVEVISVRGTRLVVAPLKPPRLEPGHLEAGK